VNNRLMKRRSPLWIRRAHHERGPLVLSLSKDLFISLSTPVGKKPWRQRLLL